MTGKVSWKSGNLEHLVDWKPLGNDDWKVRLKRRRKTLALRRFENVNKMSYLVFSLLFPGKSLA
jgi:hypothetical protein